MGAGIAENRVIIAGSREFNDYEIANINTLVAVENEKSGNQGYQLDQAGYDITKVSTISLKN